MTVAIVDYGSGNLRSVAKALERASHEAGLRQDIVVTAAAETVAAADRIVLPGVGAFGDCRRGLDALPGMTAALQEAVIQKARPFLGICVGMQLMARIGRELGDCAGLDWIPGEVVALRPGDPALKIPHMGWNDLHIQAPDHPVLADLGPRAHVYFVHGYELRPDDPAQVLATADYGGPVTAAVGHANIIGTQFHPEKSQAAGLSLLQNFLRWQA